jgi:hypothetical protein
LRAVLRVWNSLTKENTEKPTLAFLKKREGVSQLLFCPSLASFHQPRVILRLAEESCWVTVLRLRFFAFVSAQNDGKGRVRNDCPRVILSRRVSDVSKDPMGLWLTSFVGSFDYVALRSG